MNTLHSIPKEDSLPAYVKAAAYNFKRSFVWGCIKYQNGKLHVNNDGSWHTLETMVPEYPYSGLWVADFSGAYEGFHPDKGLPMEDVIKIAEKFEPHMLEIVP